MSLVSPTTGVPGKVLHLVEGLASLGHDVRLLPLSSLTPDQAGRFAQYLPSGHDAERPLPRRLGLVRYIQRQVSAYAPDIVYYRYQTSVWHWLGLRGCGVPWVQEHNTLESRELEGAENRRERRVEHWIGGPFRRGAAGLVGVTAEVLAHQRQVAARHRPGWVLPNSIRTVAPADAVRFQSTRRLVIVARFAPWHGLDRLLDLMERPEMSGFKLIIVGTGSPVDELAMRIRAARNVEHVARLEGDALDRLIQSCDMAVGAVALHRKGMREACPLKVRQYLSVGVPVVMANADPDLPDDSPFVLRVPEGDGPIPPGLVLDFHARLAADPGIARAARDHAARTMLLETRLPGLVSFFEAVLHGNRLGARAG